MAQDSGFREKPLYVVAAVRPWARKPLDLSARDHTCAAHVCSAHGGQKRASETLEGGCELLPPGCWELNLGLG